MTTEPTKPTKPTEDIVDAHIYVDPDEVQREVTNSVRHLAEDNRRLSKELADALWDPEGKTQNLGRLEFYRSARNELITERDQLQANYDRVVKRCAAAEDQRDRYRGQVEQLRVNLSHTARKLDQALDTRDRYECERDELQAEVHRLRNSEAHETVMLQVERDRLATRVDELRNHVGIVTRSRDEWKAGAERAWREPATKPRVIAADELREGQWVAIPDGANWIAGRVTLINDGWVNLEVGKRGDVHDYELTHLSEIHLLADAPDEQQEPERRGEVAQPDDLRCGDIADVWAGDKIIFDASEVKTVTADNVWFRDQGYDGIPCTTRAGHEFRLISRSIPAPVTAETIRQSEPGTTFEDEDGDVLEWDGEKLRADLHKPHYGSGDMLKADDLLPLTRSTAAPRGDYGKAEVPSGPDPVEYPVITIHKTEFEYDGHKGIAVFNERSGYYDLPHYSLRPTQVTEWTGWKPAKVVTDE